RTNAAEADGVTVTAEGRNAGTAATAPAGYSVIVVGAGCTNGAGSGSSCIEAVSPDRVGGQRIIDNVVRLNVAGDSQGATHGAGRRDDVLRLDVTPNRQRAAHRRRRWNA